MTRHPWMLLAFWLGATNPSPTKAADWQANVEAFHDDVEALAERLDVPGMAYVVVEGEAVVAARAFGQGRDGEPFTVDTPLRIASVTKHLAAVALMRLAERGQIDLDRSIRQVLPDFDGDPTVTTRQLLNHTSEGRPGGGYVYGTSRFALLGSIVTAVTGQDFATVLRQEVLDPAGMPFRPSPHLGTHAGLVATAADLGRYLVALNRGDLLTPAQVAVMAEPGRDLQGRVLPVGLGWFVQDLQGWRGVWSFGQDDPDHSGALLLWHPPSGKGLFLLANANVISDAYRLLMGDVSVSPVALAFLARFITAEPARPLALQDCDQGEAEWPAPRVDGCRSQVLTDLWTGRDDQAVAGVRALASQADLFDRDDPVLHFAALRLPDAGLKAKFLDMGRRLLDAHPDNRWLLMAQGYLAQQLDRHPMAIEAFGRILALPNQHPDHLARLFRVWSWSALAESQVATGDLASARDNLRHIVESGIGGEMAEFARRQLDTLPTD